MVVLEVLGVGVIEGVAVVVMVVVEERLPMRVGRSVVVDRPIDFRMTSAFPPKGLLLRNCGFFFAKGASAAASGSSFVSSVMVTVSLPLRATATI